jgi:hypothetical protein
VEIVGNEVTEARIHRAKALGSVKEVEITPDSSIQEITGEDLQLCEGQLRFLLSDSPSDYEEYLPNQERT